MTVVFLARRPLDAARDGADGAPRGPPVDPMAVTRRTAARRRPRPASAPRRGAASTRRGRAGRGVARRRGAASGRPPSLGWQMEANWTDPFLFFIYSVAKPVSAALILVVMLDIVSGGTATRSTAASSSSGRRSGRSCWPASPGSPGPSSTTASATGCSSTSYVSPSDFLVRAARAAASRASPSGRWARSSRSASASSLLGVQFDPGAGRLARCSSSSWSLGHRRDRRDRGAARRGLPPDAPGVVVLPGGRGRRPVPRQRRRLPARRPARAAPGARPGEPAGVVDRGRPARRLPGRHVGHRRARQPVDRSHRNRRAGRARPSSSPCSSPGRWLHSRPPASSGRASAARKDRGLLDRTTGS